MSTPDNKSGKSEDEAEGTGGPIVMRTQPKFGEIITEAQAQRQLEEDRDPQKAYKRSNPSFGF